jgi:nucleotide-binding universal stress UspA family protein
MERRLEAGQGALAMITWSRIVCAVDFSEASRTALEHAAELARRFHAELVVVHVWKGPPGAENTGVTPSTLGNEEEAELAGKLEGWEREAEQIAGREVRTLLTSGSPGIRGHEDCIGGEG